MVDAEAEADRLYAFIDALALHMILQPSQYPISYCESLISDHLHSLCMGR
ncbi:TetR family transcriptional regulator C-terminal domain-containing protein [Marininema mesophilum]